MRAESVSPMHAHGEGIIQKCEYCETGIVGAHFRGCLPQAYIIAPALASERTTMSDFPIYQWKINTR